jgi:hypothetical protein
VRSSTTVVPARDGASAQCLLAITGMKRVVPCLVAALVWGAAASAAERKIDFDGDGRADFAVYNPANGHWSVRLAATGANVTMGFGGSGYTPVPQDYDGDGKTDFAVYHSATGLWYMRASSTGSVTSRGFGGPEYVPLRGDFDGDGRGDVAVYHPPSGHWFLRHSQHGTTVTIGFGGPAYAPVPADYDGDGRTNVAAYHRDSGVWYVRASSHEGVTATPYGSSVLDPLRGDFDGDGKADFAVHDDRNNENTWWIRESSTGTTRVFGGPNNGSPVLPVPMDTDGNGRWEPWWYDALDGQWRLQQSPYTDVFYGGPEFVPVNPRG